MTNRSTTPSWLDLFIGAASGLAMMVAALVLAGGTWELALFKGILTDFILLKMLPAVLFLLAGLSLWLQLHRGLALGASAKAGQDKAVEERTAVLLGANQGLQRERQRAEERISHAKEELEERVQERTAQLELANKELESFSYSVSHDLRAPLRHIQGYANMLEEATAGQLSEKAGRYLKTITDASVEMAELIDDLLAFSRMSRTEMHESRVALDGMVQVVIRELERETEERNLLWKVNLLPEVRADPAMLKQVLVNLLGNAVKYTRPRDPAEIEIGCEGEENGRVILFVRDNGAGFDMQYVHKLFGVFQRLHRADEFEGTGIGLATVRRIVSRHGGRTWAQGKVERGATFYFTLERAPAV